MIGEPPIQTAKLKRKRYAKNKFKKIVGTFQKQMKTVSQPESRMHEVNTSSSSSDEGNDKQEFKEMINQLKRKFHKSDPRSRK
jgi:hypothetical protein